MFDRSLVWLRRDLRLSDHRALSEAEIHSKQICLAFIFDTTILSKLKNKDDKRISFIYESLQEIDEKLRKKGSSLIVRYGDPTEEIPKIAELLKIDAVFTNEDYEPYALKRDDKVKETLHEKGRKFLKFQDQVIMAPHEIKTLNGDNYKVFTPYSKAWRKELTPQRIQVAPVKLSKLLQIEELKKSSDILSIDKTNFKASELWLKAGPQAAQDRLKAFIDSQIKSYKEKRDFPALSNATSGLSVHLRFGTLSIREAYRASLRDKDSQVGTGIFTWQNELIWREFYQMILAQFPYVVKSCFQKKYDAIQWPGSKEHFELWCQGQTGFPIVDAAMRHFNKTGWMHNRLRMIVASFLTKDLLCDWRWGERYFAEKLLDFDLSANNGGWQWAASVGCDAQPYFRIFNPQLQSQRFDPDGVFLKQELPELEKIPAKLIHSINEIESSDLKRWNVTLGKEYPKPIINHKAQKEKVLKLFSI